MNREHIESAAKELGLILLWEEEIRPGDLYLAQRNQEPKLLTCKAVQHSYVIPDNNEYFYDTWECVKVKESC